MAPRLSRWSAMTAVAAVLVAVMFLTTGGAPLLYSGYGEVNWESEPRTLLQRRYEGVQRSLERVRAQRAGLELHTLLADALRRTDADPVAFTKSGSALILNRPFTAALDSAWNELPARRPDIRTVVLWDSERGGWYDISTTLDSTGLCIARVPERGEVAQLMRGIRVRAGACMFAESFGVPGAGMAGWMRGAFRFGIPWGREGRQLEMLWGLSSSELSTPAWFATDRDNLWDYGSGWRYRPLGRSEMACLVGRAGQCEVATGVGAAGWPGLGPTLGYINQRLPSPGVPRDLLSALGPDRFGRIWSSPDPIAVSYQRVTGAPIDGWLRQWAHRHVQEPPRDNALSLLGWVGAFLWLALLGLLTFERLKQRSVT